MPRIDMRRRGVGEALVPIHPFSELFLNVYQNETTWNLESLRSESLDEFSGC